MIKHLMIAVIALSLSIPDGCDHEDRLKRLEKDNQDLKAQVSKDQAVTDYDLQAKCSRDAKAWFNGTWSRDKDTVLLTYTNHYNKALNKCYIWVEYHYRVDKNGSWYKDLLLTDVYENSTFGNFSESHLVFGGKVLNPDVIMCEMWNKECKTGEEFNNFAATYLTN